MKTYYTDEKNVQILIALLKAHGIRRVIASPGTTNIPFVRSLQNDPFFKIYSSVDERSACYMACGLSSETGEPVVLSCTGATASRNYLSGLTEAYYRKLPVIAITSTQDISKIGHHIPQVIDRTIQPNDVVKCSMQLPLVKDDNDLWECEVKVNNALLELSRHGGGPVHINLMTRYCRTFETKELPSVRVIKRIMQSSEFPPLPNGRIAIFIGSHGKMDEKLTNLIDSFCEINDAVVFCDHTSGYKGKYRVLHAISSSQRESNSNDIRPKMSIHIGEITGDYSSGKIIGKSVWRVSEDGELRDTYRKLQYVFEMSENKFFEHYIEKHNTTNFTGVDNKILNKECLYIKECTNRLNQLRSKIPDMPFSNIWVASKMHNLVPENSVIHFGILNSLRSWNFFELPNSVDSSSNVGGFGIDGCVSSLIGASFANREKLYFGVFGDLAFFYDLNSIGNRHVGNNLRILLVNNGKGTEFRNFNHIAAQFGESAEEFIAAGGHYGNKSQNLVKNYSENLGFEYLSASNKEEFNQVYERFLTAQMLDKPILFEIFTNSEDESRALEIITSIDASEKNS